MKEIIEGNKLIAEFDGFTYYPDNTLNGIKGVLSKEGKWNLHANVLGKTYSTKYRTSWNWLMPVVEKISKLGEGYDVEIRIYGTEQNDAVCQIINHERWELAISESKSKIEAVWQACIQFIQWYNKTQSQ